MLVFILIPKKGNAKECSNYYTTALTSHASKVILKILQVRLQQYMELKLSDVQAGFRKGRGTRDQIVIEKGRKFQKNIYSCFIDYTKAFDCMDHNKLWKILKEMKYQTISPASWETCEAGQEATVRAGHGTTDWFQTGKGVCQGYIFSPCLFNLYAEYNHVVYWAGGSTAGIKIARRNINNLRYVADTTLMAESKEELKGLLMRVKKESEKRWLKTEHSKN